MTDHHATFASSSPDDTARLARRLGARLVAGDSLLLSGGIGAGKSHFARALILSRLAEPEDVPSPTFTLVQTYDLPDAELWHADLYRLADPDQIVELGLMDAFQTAICLVEWPDRLGDLAPQDALRIGLADSAQDDSRRIDLDWSAGKWTGRIADVMG
ncbi:tRNA (adenosine(37)-N6)-threonylcarbamoyltransferase complex ATPase subunit type 1 TsaE [Marivita sp. GX14005]|uniref:tRNA (adenosine(37)-N6)-threonylcarbamoyltransferase complex ATPase subunit type 1 TsaE n=1 Tax=Marivita sp. GX14005 TaxID=2942276 RepID=UPI00201A0B30|nr:tRNA (adenosine(37)-N6)-threonylcarbamoyltransferase complex ATPase subunit type 1 TsaE [Marivita sp. GX14005]MCL3881594.1 tRNA (adenosine(37)-N6)-threonylcarbamoyltransferase complex ATPase subunit type 1 TsaE [Marivita sp. GX14005]